MRPIPLFSFFAFSKSSSPEASGFLVSACSTIRITRSSVLAIFESSSALGGEYPNTRATENTRDYRIVSIRAWDSHASDSHEGSEWSEREPDSERWPVEL